MEMLKQLRLREEMFSRVPEPPDPEPDPEPDPKPGGDD